MDRKPVGVIEAKKEEEGVRLTVHEDQSTEYAKSKLKHLNNEPLPFVYESTGTLTRFTDYDESITQSLKQAEALRQSILKKAFSGKLVPQDPNDEPAEKLLARIRAERTAQTPLRSRRRPDSRPEALKRGPLV